MNSLSVYACNDTIVTERFVRSGSFKVKVGFGFWIIFLTFMNHELKLKPEVSSLLILRMIKCQFERAGEMLDLSQMSISSYA